MEEYQITVKVKPEWLKQWSTVSLEGETINGLELWMEIQTTGTGISVESVSKIDNNEESTE